MQRYSIAISGGEWGCNPEWMPVDDPLGRFVEANVADAEIERRDAEIAKWNEKWKRSVESHQAASTRAETAERELAEARELLRAAACFVVYDQGTGPRVRREERETEELTARIDAFLVKEQADG